MADKIQELLAEIKALQADKERLVAETIAAQKLAASAGRQPMTNVNAKLDGTMLTIVMDLSARHGASSSGKTELVASTHGNRVFECGGKRVYVGVNAYAK